MNLFRQWVTVVLLYAMIMGEARAVYIYPTHDQGRYASVLNKIASAGNQIKKWSELVGSVRDQINTLGEVASAIRDLRGVISESVRGLAGQLAAELGIDDLMQPFKAFQDLVTDSQQLLADAKSLPDEAKARLKEIGYSIDDVRRYLREGVVYDTFTKLGVEEWKEVAKDPWNAFKNGSVGMAIARTEGYLDERHRGEAWENFMGGLNDEQKKNLGPLIGGAYAAHLGGVWYEKMEHRTKAVVDFRNVGNKLSNVVENMDMSPGTGKEAASNVLQDMKTLVTAKGWKERVHGKASIDIAGSQHVIQSSEARRLQLENEELIQQQTEDETKAALESP